MYCSACKNYDQKGLLYLLLFGYTQKVQKAVVRDILLHIASLIFHHWGDKQERLKLRD